MFHFYRRMAIRVVGDPGVGDGPTRNQLSQYWEYVHEHMVGSGRIFAACPEALGTMSDGAGRPMTDVLFPKANTSPIIMGTIGKMAAVSVLNNAGVPFTLSTPTRMAMVSKDIEDIVPLLKTEHLKERGDVLYNNLEKLSERVNQQLALDPRPPQDPNIVWSPSFIDSLNNAFLERSTRVEMNESQRRAFEQLRQRVDQQREERIAIYSLYIQPLSRNLPEGFVLRKETWAIYERAFLKCVPLIF